MSSQEDEDYSALRTVAIWIVTSVLIISVTAGVVLLWAAIVLFGGK